MPRPLRPVEGGLFYHLCTRGNRGQHTFLSQADRYDFLARLRKAVRKYEWVIYAHCLMSNHYHLLLQTPEPNVSEGMQWLNGSYAQAFNLQNGYRGHLFGGRFHSVVIEDTEQLKWCARYVVRNPVRAGITLDPAEWAWSSFRATAGLAPRQTFLRPELLLQLFDRNAVRARERYVAFVRDDTLPERPPWAMAARGMARV